MKKVPFEMERDIEKGLPPINVKNSEDMEWQFNKVPLVEAPEGKKGNGTY
jgi:hypothetical protein